MRVAAIVGAFIFAVMSYPIWRHHNVRLESPVFATAAAAATWTKQQASKGPGSACVPASIDSKTTALAEEEGFFVLYKCNTPTVYAKLAGLFLVPFAIVVLLARLAFRKRG